MTRKSLVPAPDARILVRAANWVGDAVMTTPVLRAIRRHSPKARITVLAKPWVVPVYEHNPHIDDVMIYQDKGRHRMGTGTLTLAFDIRARDFDFAILLQNAFEAALIAFLARIPRRAGYNTDGRSLLLNPAVRLSSELKKKHVINYYLGLLHGLGIADDGPEMELFLAEKDLDFARSLLKKQGIDTSAPVIGINPGAAGGTAKRWFPDRYADLARKIGSLSPNPVLIFGSPGDEALGETVNRLSGSACINLAGKTTLGQAFALLKACDLFITNDSGLMHAAAALDVRQVAIIGSTDHVATAPFSDKSRLVRVPVPCSPCLKPECPTDHECMDLIHVDMVLDQCSSLLSSLKK